MEFDITEAALFSTQSLDDLKKWCEQRIAAGHTQFEMNYSQNEESGELLSCELKSQPV